MDDSIKISDYDYGLPEERIARYPVDNREDSKLLVYRDGIIAEQRFGEVGAVLPPDALLVFNNTRVIRARLVMHKPSGARIEIFCLEPHRPADYERAFAVKGACRWKCMVGNSKKWKDVPLEIVFQYEGGSCKMSAYREDAEGNDRIVRFEWDADITFGQLLEHLGKIPIPPYLGRDTQQIDYNRYQTVYSRVEGSVAAPTAGLHFSDELLGRLRREGFRMGEVTLHVGAGTFLPVKADNPVDHPMHTEHFEVGRELLDLLLAKKGSRVAVGTTTVRTIESLPVLGARVVNTGSPDVGSPVGQWEGYGIDPGMNGGDLIRALAEYMDRNGLKTLNASTRIMIMPGFRFRVTDAVITNFHQPKSTLLLLVSALVGADWKMIYEYALANGFRFLSYGDSSILYPPAG